MLANILTGLKLDEFYTRSEVGAGTTTNPLTDPLGRVLALADSLGAVQTKYTYEPFGRTTATGGNNTNVFQFTGREIDANDLYYHRARYYHAALQRFMTEDPIGFTGGDYNLFAYVKNRPVTKRDPLGLVPCSSVLLMHSRRRLSGMELVAAGSTICVAGAGLACAAAGPGYAACFAAFTARCVHAAIQGFELCTAITSVELAHCWGEYIDCLKR